MYRWKEIACMKGKEGNSNFAYFREGWNEQTKEDKGWEGKRKKEGGE